MSDNLRLTVFACEQQLKSLEPLFTPGMRLTLVARHLEDPDAYVVVTSDPDLTKVRAVIEAHQTE